MESILDSKSAFVEASDAVRGFTNVDQATMLRLYGLYKQATQGPCNTSKPGIFSYTARQKWEAWNSLKATSSEDAKSLYIDLVNNLAESQQPDKRKISALGVAVSCLAKTEQDLNDCDKTIYDWLKEANTERVSSLLKDNPSLICEGDESDMTLIHWAADRGDTAMIQLLVKNGADVNVADGDGQRPLHYAFACGHEECIALLEKLGADRNLRDKDGTLPADTS